MIRGLYSATSGMLVSAAHQDVIANNIANVSTRGFKRDHLVSRLIDKRDYHRLNDTTELPLNREFQDPFYIGQVGNGVLVNEIRPAHLQGQLKDSERSLDMAIEGRGFFVVEAADGQMLLTRNGEFQLNQDGVLIDNNGNKVMAGNQAQAFINDGTINSPRAEVNLADFDISSLAAAEDGTLFVEGEAISQLLIVNIDDENSLKKLGENYFSTTSGSTISEEAPGLVHNFSQELSNVESVKEMVAMITTMRSFESSSQVVRHYDNLLQRAAQIGQLGG